LDSILDDFKGIDTENPESMDDLIEKMMSEMVSKDALLHPIRQIVEMVS
jgi:hypothetical protein